MDGELGGGIQQGILRSEPHLAERLIAPEAAAQHSGRAAPVWIRRSKEPPSSCGKRATSGSGRKNHGIGNPGGNRGETGE